MSWLAASITGATNLIGGHLNNKANAKEASKNRGFQASQSSSAYQRATDDMRAAGINPMLAYQQGGSSTPGGSQATMQDPSGPAISSALQLKKLNQEIKESKSRMVLNKELTYKAFEDASLSDTSARNVQKQGKLLDYQMNAAKNQSDFHKKTKGVVPYIDQIKKTLK
jgi:hypothetical protein